VSPKACTIPTPTKLRQHGIPASSRERVRGRGLLSLAAGVLGLLAIPEIASSAHQPRPYFQITETHGRVAFETRWDQESLELSSGEDRDKQELSFEEEFAMGGGGWLYHPALLRFSGEAALHLTQRPIISVQHAEDTSNWKEKVNRIYGNMNLFILPEKPYAAKVHFSQRLHDVDAPLTPRQRIESTRYGLAWNLSNLSLWSFELPTSINYLHTDTDAGRVLGTDQIRDVLQLSTTNRTEYTRTSLEFEMSDSKTRPTAGWVTTRAKRLGLSLQQQLDLSEVNLLSRLRMHDQNVSRDQQRGDFDSRGLDLFERLVWHHREDLSSTYSYRFENREDLAIRRSRHDLEVGLVHQFYRSIRSAATAGTEILRSDFVRHTNARGGFDFDYTKEIPGGRLGLRFAPNWHYRNEDTVDGFLPVADESHAVLVGVPIYLNNPRVDSQTILVVDSGTARIYQEGVDYEVIQEGIRTALRVIPGSDLDPDVAVPPPSSTIEVSYQYELLPDRIFVEQTLTSGMSLDLWDRLTLSLFHQDVTFDVKKGPETDETRGPRRSFQARLRVRFPHNRTTFEYENVDEFISPREVYRLTHQIDFRPYPFLQLNGSFEYRHQEYLETGDDSDTYFLSFRASARLPYRLRSRLRLSGRKIRYSRAGDATQVAGFLAFSGAYRSIEYDLEAGIEWNDSKPPRSSGGIGSREFNKRVHFRIVRSF
jgi:hypothetical protein